MDIDDTRCKALLRLLEALPALEQPPKALLLENVPEFRGSRAYERLRSTLYKSGYAFEEHMLNPVDFGFPNSRTRFYLIALLVGHEEVAAAATEVLADLPGVPGESAPSMPSRPVAGLLERQIWYINTHFFCGRAKS